MRAERIAQRGRLRMSVKERQKKISELIATAFLKGAVMGRDSVIHAADHLSYGEGYFVEGSNNAMVLVGGVPVGYLPAAPPRIDGGDPLAVYNEPNAGIDAFGGTDFPQ